MFRPIQIHVFSKEGFNRFHDVFSKPHQNGIQLVCASQTSLKNVLLEFSITRLNNSQHPHK